MSSALQRLRLIGKRYPFIEKEIEEWIKDSIVELSIDTTDRIPQDKEHEAWLIRHAQEQLGVEVAKHFNPYPKFETQKDMPYLRCRQAVLVFKNDLGKGIAP